MKTGNLNTVYLTALSFSCRCLQRWDYWGDKLCHFIEAPSVNKDKQLCRVFTGLFIGHHISWVLLSQPVGVRKRAERAANLASKVSYKVSNLVYKYGSWQAGDNGGGKRWKKSFCVLFYSSQWPQCLTSDMGGREMRDEQATEVTDDAAAYCKW